MSFDGHVDWKRIDTGLVWPFEIMGKPSVAAPAAAPVAALRNLRRDWGVLGAAAASDFVLRIMFPPKGGVVHHAESAGRWRSHGALVPLRCDLARNDGHYI